MSNHTKVDGDGNVVIVDSTVTINSGSDVADKITQLRQEILKTISDKLNN